MDIKLFQELTRPKAALFGLPFILSGAFLGCCQVEAIPWMALVWIIPAFFTIRTAGMAFNQLIDWKIDKQNPRTQRRPIPSGRIKPKEVRLLAFSSLALFLLITTQINRTVCLLAPIAACVVYLYSYTKRVTWACHLVLGIMHFLGPVMAFGAITNMLTLEPLLLGLGAFCMVASHDIFYALQDIEFDQAHRIYSIPAYFGRERSRLMASLLQSVSLLFFFILGITSHLSWVYWPFFLAAGIFFVSMHRFKSLESALFFGNTGVSISIFLGVLGGALW